MKTRISVEKLAVSAVLLALSIALSFVTIWAMPMGGEVTLLSMLPVALVSFKYGLKQGFLTAFLFSLFHLVKGILSGNVFVYTVTVSAIIICVLFDYLVPFTAIGLAGLFRKKGMALYHIVQGIPINKRKIGICILLSIVTFGIYQIYWQYLLVKNIKALKNDESKCTGEMLCLIFVPFYSIYWWFTRGKIVKDKFTQLGYSAIGNEIAYLILGIYGIAIVSMAIMQNDFNSLESESTQSIQQSSNRAVGAAFGMALACIIRFACHFVTGVVIWGQWAPVGQSKFIYSLLYNGPYMFIECVLSCIAIVLLAISPFWKRYIIDRA